jgi:hypothetical protein
VLGWGESQDRYRREKAGTLGRRLDGDVWTQMGPDADTKLRVSYLVGRRDAGWAKEFMQDCASRIKGRGAGHDGRTQGIPGGSRGTLRHGLGLRAMAENLWLRQNSTPIIPSDLVSGSK